MNKDYQRIKLAIEFLNDNYSSQPSLEELSDAIHLSPYHLQRLFMRWTGVTSKQFLQCVTLKNTNSSLRNGDSVLSATINAGLSSSSRLHDLYTNFHGMSPAQYKNKGQGLSIAYAGHETLFGNIVIGMTEKGICNLFFSQSICESGIKQQLQVLWPNAELVHNSKKTQYVVQHLLRKWQTPNEKVDVHVSGTNFQIKVWQALLQIPFGMVCHYGQITNMISSKGASRAVGSAVGKNPIALLIPCHRVIKSTGIIGDYHWGKKRKKVLLT